ncbi:MAG: sigma-54 interaction domain-containing protein [Halodesulfovibrio sp.]|uniref:sigma-54 interaction domain-containing protein n=1 Tax=Halodesulfovibrio sp. TaxID=1912772 RepID=UPI00359D7A84
MALPSYKKLISNCANGIFFCDTEGIIQCINERYAVHAGTTVKEATGKFVLEVFPNSPAMDVLERSKPSTTFMQTVASDGPSVIQICRTLVYEGNELLGLLTETSFMKISNLDLLDKRVRELQLELEQYKSQLSSQDAADASLENIIGESDRIRVARDRVRTFARTDYSVMIQGNTGVGKELFAQALHSCSTRAKGPFISVNCSSVPVDLFEAEMFGYTAGAFTGARSKGKVGLFELANKGTLFLDEIAEAPLLSQKKFLRVLEEKCVRPVGGVKSHKLDFRLVVATNQDLEKMVDEGLFRSDLYYRIATLTLTLPSLAQRIEDIPLLIHELSAKMLGFHLRVTDEAMHSLQQYHWPGNVRQLRNVIAYMSLNCRNCMADIESLPEYVVEPTAGGDLKKASGPSPFSPTDKPISTLQGRLDSNSKQDIHEAINRCCGNMTLAAKLLGISRSGLYVKCNRFGITRFN